MRLWHAQTEQPPSPANSQSTSPHLFPTLYESLLVPKDGLFPFETGILSWPGVVFLRICLRNRSGKQWVLIHVLLPCAGQTIFQARKHLSSSPSQVMVWGSWYQRFGGVIVDSLLPTGAKTWVTAMLYAAQQSFDRRVRRPVSSCIHL